MAVKEFEFGPKDYFEDNYMSGDYTAPGIVRSLLQCDIDQIYGGVVLTGEYYEGEYIDGTYFHDNSIKATFACDVTRAIGFEIGITDYFAEDYFEDSGYAETRGSEFALTADGGKVIDAEADFGALFTPAMSVGAIKNSFSIMDAVFTPTVDANATFVANQITLDSIINQSLMGTKLVEFTFSTNSSDPTNPVYTTFQSTVFIDVPTTTLFKGFEATFQEAAFTFAPSNTFNITTDIELTLDNNVTMSCDALLVKNAEADITSSSSVYAQPISYEVRTFTNRPYQQFQDGYVISNYTNGQEIVYPLTFNTSTNGGLEKYTEDSSTSSIANYTPNSFLIDGQYANGNATHAYSYTFLESRQSTVHQFYDDDFAVSFYFNYVDANINRNNFATIFRLGYNNTKWSGRYINETTRDILCATGESNDFGAQEAIEVIADRTGDFSAYDLLVKFHTGGTVYNFTSTNSPQGWIKIQRKNNVVTVYRNGSSIGSATVSGNLYPWRYIGFYPHEAMNAHTSNHTWVNNLIIQKGTTDIKTSNGSYNGTPLNDEYTFARYTFDGTMEDITENWLLETGAQSDSLVATMTAVPNAVKDGVTIHLGTATLSISTEVLKPASAGILSDFNLEADVESVVTINQANLETEFSLTADNQIARTFTASINSITNTTATATRIKPLDADFDSIATSINVINKIGNTLVEFTPGVFSTTVSADRFRGIVGIEPGVFEVTATATHIKNFEIDNAPLLAFVTADVNYRPDIYMDNGGLGTVEADVNVIRGAEGNFECEINLTPTTRGIIGFDIDLTSATAQNAVGVKKVTVDSSLIGIANQSSTAVKTVDIDADLDSGCVLTTVTSRTRDVETEFDSIASQASAVAKIGDFLITLESAFTIEVEVTKTSGVGGILDSVATIETTPFRLIDREIDPVDSEFNTIIYGTKGTDTTSNISSETDVEADVNVVVVGEADISDAVSFAITVKATRTGDIDADSNFSLSAQTAQARTRATTVDVDSVSEFEAAVSKTVGVDIAIQSSVAISITAKVIVVDAITFKIPKEYRVFQINKEDREHQVQFEQRETTIGA